MCDGKPSGWYTEEQLLPLRLIRISLAGVGPGERKACGREGLGGAGPRERSAKPRAPRNRQRPASVARKVLNCLELETMVASVGRWGRQSAHGLPLPANEKEGQTKGKAFAPASWAWLALRERENVPFHFCVR